MICNLCAVLRFVICNLPAIFRFHRLGWAEAQCGVQPEDAECLKHNRQAFLADLVAIGGSHPDDCPEEGSTPERAFIAVTAKCKIRRVEIRGLFHEHGQCLALGARKAWAYGFICLLLLAEGLMVRPALRILFIQLGYIESLSYMVALVAGLALMIHIAGTSLRSKRFALAAVALLVVFATNGLLIASRALAMEGSTWLLTSLFACVAVLITKGSIYLTYRMSHDESVIGPPAVDFEPLAEEYRMEGVTLRRLRQSHRRFKALEKAFYRGFYAQRISQSAALKLRRVTCKPALLLAMLSTGLEASAADGLAGLSVEILAKPGFVQLGDKPVAIDLRTSADNPKRFLGALTGIQIHLSGPGLSEKYKLESADKIPDWSWQPSSPGNYRIKLSALTRGGYPVSAQTDFEVLKPAQGYSPPVAVPFVPAGEFEVSIPVPEIPYPKLDLCFLIDISGSMSGEIAAVKKSASAIFDNLGEFSQLPMASVLTFSEVHSNRAGLLEAINYKVALAPTADRQALAGMNVTTEGGNECMYYAMYHASQQGGFRPDALKFLLLMTDEIDNIYEHKPDLEREWQHGGRLSPRSILTALRSGGFCVGLVYSELAEEQAKLGYADVMESVLGPSFAGAHPLSLSSEEMADRIVGRIRSALETIVGRTKISLRVADAGNSQWIAAIRPSEPADCVLEDGFNLGRLRERKATNLVFKVTMGASTPKASQRFFLIGSTDKGTINHMVPIVLTH